MSNRYPFTPFQARAGVEQQNVPGFSSNNMWQQQTQTNAVGFQQQQQQLQLAEKQRQKEYIKQQQKLRLMAATTNKQLVSADKLIENLLDTKDTFQLKVNPQQTPTPVVSHAQASSGSHLAQHSSMPMAAVRQAYHPLQTTSVSNDVSDSLPTRTLQDSSSCNSSMNFQLPSWLTPQSPSLPALYRQVWSIVGLENGLVDTSKIFPILLTSGLPTDVLGYIWSIANKKIAGQLMEDELYIVLALVGLAQNGCTFNNLGVLNLVPQAPIPNLNLTSFQPPNLVAESSVPVSQTPQSVQSVQKIKTSISPVSQNVVAPDVSLQSFNHIPVPFSSSISKEVPEEEIDDFSDFQSAYISQEPERKPEYESPVRIKDNLSSPPPVAFQGGTSSDGSKSFTSFFSLGSSSRGIGSRLANHSLGAPKQGKSRHHKHHHHHHHHHRNAQPVNQHNSSQLSVQSMPRSREDSATVVALEGEEEDDDFSDFQQAKDVVSRDSVDSSDLFSKCSTSKPYLLKESAIRSEQANTVLFDSPPHIKVKPVEEKEMSTNTEATLIVKAPTNDGIPDVSKVVIAGPGPELLSVEEDKYSALRALSVVDQEPQDSKEVAPDDFGDFLSAEPVSTEDSFVALAVRDVNVRPQETLFNNTSVWPSTPENITQNVEFQVDDWGAFESAIVSNNSCDTDISDSIKTGIIGSTVLNLATDLEGLDLKSSSSNFTWDVLVSNDPKALEKNFVPVDNITNLPSENITIGDHCVESNEEFSQNQSSFKEINPPQSESGSFVINATDDDDEFGEFIGPEAWSEDGKFGAKESGFEDPSVLRIKDATGDSQSVSSLELPVLSRHGSLPSLDLKIFPASADKTGMLHSWESSPQIDSSLHGTVAQRSTNQEGIDLQIKEWCRCLQSCLQLLQAALATFTSVSNDFIVDEVVKSHDGKEYLLNLIEVYGICRRVKQSSNGVCNDSKLDSILAEVDMIWSSVELYFTKANMKVSEMDFGCNATDVTQEHTPCGICLTCVGSDIVEDNPNNIYPLEYSGQVYHAACANLWVNCVDCRLPALASTGSLL